MKPGGFWNCGEKPPQCRERREGRREDENAARIYFTECFSPEVGCINIRNMLIGIVSDTHDKTHPLIAALRQLRSRGAEYFIHCGDVGGEHVLDQFAGLPVTFIWGNNEWDVAGLEDYAKRLGLSCGGRLAEFDLGGKSFAVTHGDQPSIQRKILEAQQTDYLLQGHTHVFSDARVGRTRVINPGALYRAQFKTVALLDTAADRLDRIVVGT